MASYNDGKADAVAWILEQVGDFGKILDVGACDGKWSDLIKAKRRDIIMDACEIWKPNIPKILNKYDSLYVCNIRSLRYRPYDYDVVIFGDVLEHMTVTEAKIVLQYARNNVPAYIIGVPFLYKQGPINGNPYERHIQDDLTPELFEARYPGHDLLCRPRDDYAYYTWRRKL